VDADGFHGVVFSGVIEYFSGRWNMRANWIALLSFGSFLGLFWGTSASQHVMSDEPKKSGSGEVVEHSVPPDIKVGVRIQFISGQLFTPRDAAAKVTKIEGSWAYMEGGMAHEAPGNTWPSGWVNLSKLEWYRIVEEKKEP
jgi:hypothetical protein